ncbi:MAG: DUF885 domain-containing protein [Bryobacteraceae bacterium]
MRIALLLTLISSCALAQDDTQKLHLLFDDVYKGVLRENPEAGTIFGIPGSNDRWSDLSPEGLARERKMLEGFQTARAAIHRDRLNPTDQLNYDVLGRYAAAQIEQREFQLYFMLTNQMTGIHLQISNAFERAPKVTLKDYEDLLARMKAVPLLLDQTKAILNQAIAKGITTPKIVLRYLPDQLAAQTPEDPHKSPLMESFEKMPASISASDRDRLKTQADRIYRESLAPAIRSYRSYLQTTYIPKGRDVTPVTEMPNGKEWYAMQVRLMTTTNQTPQEIHDLGLSEVKRIRAELEKIQKEVHFKGSFTDFQKYLTTDPKFFYKTPEELLAAYRAVAKRADPEMVKLFNKLPRMPYGVISIPDYEAPASAAHYAPPAKDGTRAGYFYANIYLPSGVPSWTMDSLVFHEAVPGHHMQLALAQENPNIPDFRSLWILSAYSEGWGLYAESLGDEIGFYQTPYTRFGKFNSEMFRACRLVVDTGLHALGWSRQQALDYFRENTGGERVSEVDRYIAWPGQALSYKMGELKIKELRAKAEKQLGPKFNLRDFHDVILGNGALPFDLLEQQVDAYLKKAAK